MSANYHLYKIRSDYGPRWNRGVFGREPMFFIFDSLNQCRINELWFHHLAQNLEDLSKRPGYIKDKPNLSTHYYVRKFHTISQYQDYILTEYFDLLL